MTDIAEITLQDREKIKRYVEETKNINFTMLAERFKISKSQMSNIINGKNTSAEANRIIDSIMMMYGLQKQEG